MKKAILFALVLGGCGGDPLATDHWSMSWVGQCDGQMSGGFFDCGSLAGTYSVSEGAIDFGVAKAVVTTSGDRMTGVVTSAAGEVCFSAQHD